MEKSRLESKKTVVDDKKENKRGLSPQYPSIFVLWIIFVKIK